jgi:hypothetical protein
MEFTGVSKLVATGALIMYIAGAEFAINGILGETGLVESGLLIAIFIAGLLSIFVERKLLLYTTVGATTIAALTITMNKAIIAIMKSEEVSTMEKWTAAILTKEALVVLISVGGALLMTEIFKFSWKSTKTWMMWPIIIAVIYFLQLQDLQSYGGG